MKALLINQYCEILNYRKFDRFKNKYTHSCDICQNELTDNQYIKLILEFQQCVFALCTLKIRNENSLIIQSNQIRGREKKYNKKFMLNL